MSGGGETGVVVTCYNLGSLLLEALDSVYVQSRQAAEVLIVDDGSTDGQTIRILETIEARGTCVVRASHKGVAAARNHGISLIGTDYVLLLDGDDVLAPECIETMAGALDEHQGLAFVTSGIRSFGDIISTWMPPECTPGAALTRGGPHISSLFRRRLWEAAGGFDESLENYEDTDFWIKAMRAGLRGTVLPSYLLNYRVRRNSRYAQAVVQERHASVKRTLFERHLGTLADQEQQEVLIDAFRIVAEQQVLAGVLSRRTAVLAADAAAVADGILQAQARLSAMQSRIVERGDLDCAAPLSTIWGFDRGTPVDRALIADFLEQNRDAVHGRVLEVKDAGYARQFGRADIECDVLDIDATNPHATIVADLSCPEDLPAQRYDCIILTQVLHIIFDVRAALAGAYRMLKPGGTLLCTIPCVSRLSQEPVTGGDTDYWRLTRRGVEELVWSVFPSTSAWIESRGNALAAAGFCAGLSAEELPGNCLAQHDADAPVLCTVRATRPADPGPAVVTSSRLERSTTGAVLLYHRVADLPYDRYGLAVTPAAFTQQIRHLAETCTVLELTALVQGARAGALPPRAVALTFDDGYAEHLEVAAPMLVALGLPATFFITTASLMSEEEHWWDELERLVLVEDSRPSALDLFADGTCIRPTATFEQRQAVHAEVVPVIRHASQRDRLALLQRLREWSGGHTRPRSSHRVLRASDIRRLAAMPGMAIGSHCVNHLHLPSHPSGIQDDELRASRIALQDLLQINVDAVAYPYGAHDRGAIDAARRAGYRHAVTVRADHVRCGTHALRVPRFEVPTGSSATLAWLTRTLAEG